ncbi:MAG: M20 family metallopeptidase [Pirellulales bacterium]|nr:M20 family metallopeptidase [Pirellulales bacterium]
MALDLIQTLSDLVALPSVNPMGRDVSGPEYFEYRVSAYLEALFTRLGWKWVRQEIEPLRANVIAWLPGRPGPEEGGPIVLLEAHQDTVPVDGMTIPPWTPTVSHGRIWGRGSCDIKGGMTAMLGAIASLKDNPPPRYPSIVMACTINEEHGYSGADQLPQLWSTAAGPHDGPLGAGFVPRRPDVAIVAEPTLLNVVVAHKGAVRWRLHALGRAAHSSQPHLGENAIYRMARIVQTLERYQREFVPTLPTHPRCGAPSLSVGTIRGGLSVNTVPDRCTIEIDRRLIPGETPDAAYRQVIDFLAADAAIDFPLEHERPYLVGLPLDDTHNVGLASRLAETAQRLQHRSAAVGVPFGTDAAKIAAAGVPTVVFGPGSIDQAHTADEWLAIEQLEAAAAVLAEFLRHYCD